VRAGQGKKRIRGEGDGGDRGGEILGERERMRQGYRGSVEEE
jgi:hypothetical protein